MDSYRKLTQLQEPVPTDVNLSEFVHKLSALYPGIVWNIDVATSAIFNIDENLLRQVFLNLIKNAIEAGAENIAINYNGSLIISNDGHIIPDESRKEIFIPFFTTKCTGSGIGLALSRQILMMQGYMLSLDDHSQHGYNVTFVIEKDL